MRMIAAIFITVLTVFVSACDDEPTRPEDVPDGTFLVTLHMEDNFEQESGSFLQGEPIEFVLSAINLTDAPHHLVFASSHRFDVAVFDHEKKKVLWRWSQDKAFTPAHTPLAWEPEETRVFRLEWDQSVEGEPLPVGEYHVQAVLMLVGIDPAQADPESQFVSEMVPLAIQ